MNEQASQHDMGDDASPNSKRMNWRIGLVLLTCVVSWLGMMIVHELGHVLAAFLSGGSVTKMVLHPLAISRTDVEPNPHPLLVVWSGPIFGACLPAISWYLCNRFIVMYRPLVGFFVGFCLIANGAYLAMGLIDPVGDAKTLLALGTSTFTLTVVGAMMLAEGLRIWHHLGKWVGFVEIPNLMLPRLVTVMAVILAVIGLLEFVFSTRM